VRLVGWSWVYLGVLIGIVGENSKGFIVEEQGKDLVRIIGLDVRREITTPIGTSNLVLPRLY